MSLTTLRLAHDSAIVLPTKRSPRLRMHVAACALALLACTAVNSFALELGEAVIRSGLGQPLPGYTRVGRIAITPTHIEIH